MATRPTPHGNIIKGLVRNPKLPRGEHERVERVAERYAAWITGLVETQGEGDVLLGRMVQLTNEYKRFVEFDFIYSSEGDFLYRQAGQLKLNNTILEEFLPYLVDERLVPGIRNVESLTVGPQSCYAGMFIGSIQAPIDEGGIYIKTKNQDFTVGRKLFLKASATKSFASCLNTSLNVAYFVSEIKTNLDKTMFQEAAATARELKLSVGDAVYVLLCEWLDMRPIDTRVTEIDEVIILRKAKRLPSTIRENFSEAAGRAKFADVYEKHLDINPLNVQAFSRLVSKLKYSFPEQNILSESEVLDRGYF